MAKPFSFWDKMLNSRFLVKFLALMGVVSGMGLLIYLWYPIVKAYLFVQPVKGIDLYLTVSNVVHLVKNFSSPMTSWWYQWYGGRPFESVYPFLHFYLILPLTTIWDSLRAVRLYAGACLTLFVILCYLLLYKISRNFLVALAASLAIIYSYGVYLSVFWGGNVPYFSTMFFIPLALLVACFYFENPGWKKLLLIGFISGVGLLGHPQPIVAWAIPLSSLLILFARREGKKPLINSLWQGVKDLIIYYSVVVVTGFRQIALAGLGGIVNLLKGVFMGRLVGTAAQMADHPESEATQEMLQQRMAAIKVQEVIDKVPRWMNEFIPYFLVFSAVFYFLFFIFSRKKRRFLWESLLVLLFCVYGFLFAYLFYMGMNPFAGGWIRVYWGIIFLSGLVISWFLGRGIDALIGYLQDKFNVGRVSLLFIESLIGGLILVGFLVLALPSMRGFVPHILTRSHEYPDNPEVTHEHAQESSAYPSVVNLNPGSWSGNTSKELVPSWLPADSLDYRLYDLDATVNIWWNAYYDMPLARGYIDSRGGVNYNGWQYLANIVMAKDEVVEKLNISPEMAKKQAEFFIDWHAIGYLEGRGGAIGRDYGSHFSSYVVEDSLISRSQEVNVWRPLNDFYIRFPGFWETLEYHQVKPAKTSPIYQATDAPTVLVVGDEEAQNVWVRIFSELGITSQRAILVQGRERIDGYSLEELREFDFVILYRYHSRPGSGSWEILEKYVREGGDLFVDTGDDRPKADADQLPAVFPISSNRRDTLGREWGLEGAPVLNEWGVEIGQFTEPVFDGQPWTFSYTEEEDVDQGARVLLKNHEKPILVDSNLGRGTVIWSGMNLPYHIQREHNPTELNLLEHLLGRAVTAEGESFLRGTNFERPSSQKVIIKGEGARGVLFKEAGYPGWKAVGRSQGKKQKLSIYKAGPMQPGYMYVFLPPEMRNKPFEVTFTFHGPLRTWIYYLINFMGVLGVLDLLTGKHLLSFLRSALSPVTKKLKEWWEKEDDY